MRVAITGAAGFIGGHTVREALSRGWQVEALVHRTHSRTMAPLAADGAVRVRPVELADMAAVRAALAAVPPLDAIIHCAGRASDVGREREFRRANLDSVVHLGIYCQEHDVGRLVFVSTTDVYGLRDFQGEAEDELPYDDAARNPYPLYKIRAERWLRANLPPQRFAIIRPAAVWGEGDPTLEPRFRAFLATSPFIIHFGRWRGRNRWPLADVRAVARANCQAACRPEMAGVAVNVLDSARVTIDEFYRQVAARHFPHRRFRTITLPYAIGAGLGAGVTGLSNLLNLKHPFTDPSLYALRSVSCNLDFSNARLLRLLAGE